MQSLYETFFDIFVFIKETFSTSNILGDVKPWSQPLPRTGIRVVNAIASKFIVDGFETCPLLPGQEK